MKLKSMLAVGTLTVLGVAACSQDPHVDLGDESPEGEVGHQLEDYAADWVGYVEATTFDDGSDVVRLTLDENGQGHLTFGEDAAAFPPLDPQTPASSAYPSLVGFEFPIQATVASGRLKFTVLNSEPYRTWCEAQAPIEMTDIDNGGATIYDCRPHGSSRSVGDECTFVSKWGVVDVTPDVWSCNALDLCAQHCACDASGCDVGGTTTMTIDVAFEDDETVVGTWAVNRDRGPAERVTVRMTKAE